MEDSNLVPGLDNLLAAGRAENLHGMVVIRDGQVVLERYGAGHDYAWGTDLGLVTFERHTLHDVRSVTKSVTALLYGIALDRKLVPAPDEPLLRHFPEYPDLASDAGRQALRIEHALTMTLGLEWNESLPYTSAANSEIAMEMAPDGHRYVLERPIMEAPGQRWHYCGGASALLGRLIVKGANVTLPEFARATLFEPLGIERFEWMAGADGVHSPASGLRLSPRDMARIGEAVLEGGAWGANQVIPSEWLDAALTPRVSLGGLEYGYQWYVGQLGSPPSHRFFAAMGNGDQRLIIVPDAKMVVAISAGNYDSPTQGKLPDALVSEVLLPVLS